MSTINFNQEKYKKLLVETLPLVITSEEEYQRILTSLEPLFSKSIKDNLTPEEDKLFDLLTVLIEHYEKSLFRVPLVPPLEMLKFFMSEHNKTPKDLWSIIGHKSTVSEILSGKRKINIDQAKKLAKYFNTQALHF